LRKIFGLAWRRLRLLGLAPGDAPIILMYHRIADPPHDPWGICVTADNFRSQLEFLASHRTVMSVDDLVAALDAREVPTRATAITFDDGYADNALIAKPLLESLEIPATFFLTTGLIGQNEGYWWDELADLILSGTGPAEVDISVGNVRLHASVPAQSELPPSLRNWRVDGEPPHDARQAAYASLWRKLAKLKPAHRAAAMQELRAHFGGPEAMPETHRDVRPMDWDMACTLTRQGSSVGGHARSHVPLDLMTSDDQREEISGSRSDIIAALDITPTGFAYPHGRYDRRAKKLVKEAGHSWAVSSRNQVIHPLFFDRFALPRVNVGDWTGQQLLVELASAGA